MVDPISFPVLTGAALTGAITFLYNRLAAVLDRRAAARESGDQVDNVEGISEPFIIHHEQLTEARLHRLERNAGALQVYRTHPELLRGDDDGLRQALGELRNDLEAIYGLSFSFGNENRRGAGLQVIQVSEEIEGTQRGIRAKSLSDTAQVHVDQRTKIIRPSGEMTGIEIDGPID